MPTQSIEPGFPCFPTRSLRASLFPSPVEPLIKYSILTFFFARPFNNHFWFAGWFSPGDFLSHLFFATLRETDNRVLWHAGPIQMQNAIILIFSNSLSILLRKHWNVRWIFDHEIISRKFIILAQGRKSFIPDSNLLWALNQLTL